MLKLIITLFLINTAYADFFSTKDFSASLGLQGKTLNHKRGIITYGGNQVSPIVVATLFNPNLMIAGTSLYYTQKFSNNQFIVRSRIKTNATGDTPLNYTSEEEDERVRRDKTNEFDFYLEYQTKNFTYFRYQVSIDLVAHNGTYHELYTHFPIYNIKDGLFLLGAFASAGVGDLKHNEYLYGEGAAGNSINNVEYGLTIRSPKVIDMFWPTFRVSRFQIIDEKNQNASFVKEKSGVNAEALMAFKIW